MRAAILIFALVLTLVTCCSKNDGGNESTSPSSDSASTVEKDFAALKQALLNGDGKTAASLVTAGTLRAYETSRSLALDSSGTHPLRSCLTASTCLPVPGTMHR